MANIIRKIIWKTGLDIHKHRKETSPFEWLATFNIKTVLDIGANVGQFAKEAREAFPSAHIYSFEPLKSCYDKLNSSFAGDAKFQSFNCGLGDTKTSMTIHRSEYAPSSSLLPMADRHKELFPHTKNQTDETVSIDRLDDAAQKLNLEPELLIKVDVQGYEDKVISGGLNTFKKAKVLLMEASFSELYEGQPLFHDIYSKLKSLGFSYHGSIHQKKDKKTGEILFEDSVFIRN
jgi:FkbM family methyltransferase